MAKNYVIKDRLPEFKRNLENLIDSGLRELGNDILEASRKVAPKKQGDLRANSVNRRVGNMHYRVEYNQEYAINQERGYAGGKTFRNYTTSGTGKKFLSKTGAMKSKEALVTLKKYMGQAK